MKLCGERRGGLDESTVCGPPPLPSGAGQPAVGIGVARSYRQSYPRLGLRQGYLSGSSAFVTVTFTSLVAMFAFPSVAVMVTSYTLSLSASAGFSKLGAVGGLGFEG